jgi:hypothetical protein
MYIPRSTYRDASRRLTRLAPLIFLGFGAIGMCGLFVAFPLANFLRDHVGGNLGMLLCILSAAPFAVLPILLPVGVMTLIDRRIGIRCPNCGLSLTMRCMHEKVLITRKCSNCKSTVLLDDEIPATLSTTRPWLIAILVILGVLGIAIAVVLHMIAPTAALADANDQMIQSGILVMVLLGVGWIHSLVIKVLKHRWQREATADESSQGET